MKKIDMMGATKNVMDGHDQSEVWTQLHMQWLDWSKLDAHLLVSFKLRVVCAGSSLAGSGEGSVFNSRYMKLLTKHKS